jgi:hypothetical protein
MHEQDYAPRVVARFWLKVDGSAGPTGCWEWTASKAHGYGQFGVRAGDVRMAHRYAYEYLVAPIPVDLQIDHLCRNRRCVNPAHLEPVTLVENVMRGIGPGAVNARKTHCLHGHAFDEANTYTDKSGRRQCRTCRRRNNRKHLAENPNYHRDRKREQRGSA